MSDKRPLIAETPITQSPFRKAIFSLVQPGLEKILGIEQLNKGYDRIRDKAKTPDEFAKLVLETMKIEYTLPEEKIEQIKKLEGPIVLVSNLPFGGVEALILVRLMNKIRPDFRLLGSDLMGKADELQETLMMLDPFDVTQNGASKLVQGKKLVQYLNEGGLIATFPSGTVTNLNLKTGGIKDLHWDDSIARIIQMTEANVIPIYFHGNNSVIFQIAGLIHSKWRDKLLYREFMRKQDQTVEFVVGNPIPLSRIKSHKDPKDLVQFLKAKTYLLSSKFLKDSIEFALVREQETLEEVQDLIPPVDPELIREEFSRVPKESILAEKDDYIVFQMHKRDFPHMMREIGRLREITFREVGEGTGKACDIDRFDEFYHQLVLWNQKDQRIAGGYRLGQVDKILEEHGKYGVYSTTLFKIKNKLFKELGTSIEMGRSYVIEEYQRSYIPLMLLWMGIGAWVARNPQYKVLFGPVSITSELNELSQTFLVSFLQINKMNEVFTPLVKPRNKFKTRKRIVKEYYNSFAVNSLTDVQDMIKEVDDSGFGVPILLKHYLKLGGSLLAFNLDPDFSNVLDGLIMVNLLNTDRKILNRFMGKENTDAFFAYHGK